jgi:hypothetical protein
VTRSAGTGLACSAVFLAASFLAGGAGVAAPRQRPAPDFSPSAIEHRLPAWREHRYRMNARVRPLLFWIRRDNVGSARIAWRRSGDGAARGYELLVGSDPLRAPRRINKWGYLFEEIRPESADLVGFMSRADESSVADAEASLSTEGTGGFAYKGIRGAVDGRTATAGIARLRVEQDLTYRDVDRLLELVTRAPAPTRAVPFPDGTQPGFLTAVADLIRETLDGEARARARIGSSYIYNGLLYDLSLRAIEPVVDFTNAGRPLGPALRSQFEISNRKTGQKTPFTIVYGSRGDLAGVPLMIVFRPRWWFEAELVLDDAAAW